MDINTDAVCGFIRIAKNINLDGNVDLGRYYLCTSLLQYQPDIGFTTYMFFAQPVTQTEGAAAQYLSLLVPTQVACTGSCCM